MTIFTRDPARNIAADLVRLGWPVLIAQPAVPAWGVPAAMLFRTFHGFSTAASPPACCCSSPAITRLMRCRR